MFLSCMHRRCDLYSRACVIYVPAYYISKQNPFPVPFSRATELTVFRDSFQCRAQHRKKNYQVKVKRPEDYRVGTAINTPREMSSMMFCIGYNDYNVIGRYISKHIRSLGC